jgi:hypothetical protein
MKNTVSEILIGDMSQPSSREELVASTKSFEISKHTVLAAYRRAKANKGAAVIDNESIEMFEADLKGDLYRIWIRMSSGSYFPPAVKRVEIEKKSGGTRVVGVPSVSDRIAQMVVKLMIEPQWDGLFYPDAYGYRPGKSAKQAIAVTRERCWRYDWVPFPFTNGRAGAQVMSEPLGASFYRRHNPTSYSALSADKCGHTP